MRTNLRKDLSLAAVVAGLLCFASCSKEELPGVEEESGFLLQRNVVEMTAEGGTVELLYFIENPIEDLGVEVNYDADWIDGFDTSEEGKIVFEVAAQTLSMEERSTVVEVYYGEEQQSFTVVQSGNDSAMEYELLAVRPTNYIVKVAPKDPEMRFWINTVETSVLEGLSDEDIQKIDLEIFKINASNLGMTLEEWYVQEFVNTQYISPYVLVNRLDPNTSYTTYFYGMNGEGHRLTPIYKVSATPTGFELNSGVALSFEDAVVKNGMLSVSVSPSDKDTYYYVDVLQTDEWSTSEEIMHEWQSYLDAQIFMYTTNPRVDTPPTLDQVIEMLFEKGDCTVELNLQSPKEGGRVFAYAIDAEARIVSEIFIQDFEAESQLSDNRISLTVTEVGTTSAKWSADVTNSDPYVVRLGKVEDFSGMTNEAVLDILLQDSEFSVYEGDASGYVDNLSPNTGYVVFAFGYDGGQVTTNLVRKEFYTSAEQEELACKVVYKYFDGSELYESDPERFSAYWNKVVVVAEAVVTGSPENYYYALYNKRIAESDDESLINLLTSGGANVQTTSPAVMTAMYNSEYCIVSVAEDATGMYSPVERNYVIFTVDGTSPVDEFPENL